MRNHPLTAGFRRRDALVGLFLLGVITPAPGFTAPSHPLAGARGASILTAVPGARSSSMGGAFTALADDSSALYVNPAGLGIQDGKEVAASQRMLPEGFAQRNVGIVLPSMATAGNVNALGTFGAGLLVEDYGSFTGRDASGNPSTDFKADGFLWSFGYGKTLGPLSLGVTGKKFHQRIAEMTVKGTAYDGGALYRTASGRLSMGVAVLNLGTASRLVNGNEKLPRSVAVGAAVSPFAQLTLTFDTEDPSDGDPRLKTGAEWWTGSLLALRAGYFSGDDLGRGVTMGIGIKVEDFEFSFFPVRNLMLDYAFVPSSDFGDAHNVALRLRFGNR